MWNYIWPLLVVVGANTIYNISATTKPLAMRYWGLSFLPQFNKKRLGKSQAV